MENKQNYMTLTTRASCLTSRFSATVYSYLLHWKRKLLRLLGNIVKRIRKMKWKEKKMNIHGSDKKKQCRILSATHES